MTAEPLQPPTNDLPAIALACIRYCQSQNVDIVSAMPDHFSEHPDLTIDYDSVAEAINLGPISTQGSLPLRSPMDSPAFDDNAAFPYEQDSGGPYWATGLTKREFYASQIYPQLIAKVSQLELNSRRVQEETAAIATQWAVQLEIALRQAEVAELKSHVSETSAE